VLANLPAACEAAAHPYMCGARPAPNTEGKQCGRCAPNARPAFVLVIFRLLEMARGDAASNSAKGRQDAVARRGRLSCAASAFLSKRVLKTSKIQKLRVQKPTKKHFYFVAEGSQKQIHSRCFCKSIPAAAHAMHTAALLLHTLCTLLMHTLCTLLMHALNTLLHTLKYLEPQILESSSCPLQQALKCRSRSSSLLQATRTPLESITNSSR
jgi:hypothetical protein